MLEHLELQIKQAYTWHIFMLRSLWLREIYHGCAIFGRHIKSLVLNTMCYLRNMVIVLMYVIDNGAGCYFDVSDRHDFEFDVVERIW